jgi:putative transcriptional regulator
MAFNPVPINRENLTFCGITFPDVETLNKTANAIGSNMFEGFEPTSKSVEIIRDYVMDKITIPELIHIVKEKLYV